MRNVTQFVVTLAILAGLAFVLTADHPWSVQIDSHVVSFGKPVKAENFTGLPLTQTNIERLIDARIEAWHKAHAPEPSWNLSTSSSSAP